MNECRISVEIIFCPDRITLVDRSTSPRGQLGNSTTEILATPNVMLSWMKGDAH